MNPGRTVVITGGSSGLGAVAARELAAAGWQVAVVGRDRARARAVAQSFGGEAFVADFDRLADVRALATALLDRYPRIDALANNAGGTIGTRGRSADGHERTVQLNHLAPFLLTSLLLPRLSESGGRVVNTSSVANRFARLRLDDLDFDQRLYLGGWRPYSTAKLANILFSRELARRTALSAYSFHPGFVRTSFASDSWHGRLMMGMSASRQITPETGAVPLVQLVSMPEGYAPNGTYFDGLVPNGKVHPDAADPALASRLWEKTEELVGLR